jgi:hypothetical protein
MTSTSGQHATAADDGDGLPLPAPRDQEVILDAWDEVLGQVLHTRDTEWKQQLRAVQAESLAAIGELRANAAEFRSMMERMVAERLAQIRQPIDGKEGLRGERGQKGDKGDPGELPIVRAWSDDEIFYTVATSSHATVAHGRRGKTHQRNRLTATGYPWPCPVVMLCLQRSVALFA